jgi:hypothetical protein
MNVTTIVLSKTDGNSYTPIVICPLDASSPNERYIIRNITGLDADEITPILYGVGQSTGNKFVNMRLKERNISMSLILNPNYAGFDTPGGLRDELYRMISSYRTGLMRLSFYNQNIETATIDGYITKIESDLSGDVSEAKITMRCDYPYFRSPARVNVNTLGLSKTAPVIIDSVSTAPHGFQMRWQFTDDTPGFYIQKPNDSDWYFGVTYSFQNGDFFTFSSEEDNKELYATRNGAKIQLIGNVEAGSEWPLIFPGLNEIWISSGPYNYVYLSHYTTYWGL